MKKFIVTITLALLSFAGLSARTYVKDEAKCSKADNIVGKYFIQDEQGTSYCQIEKLTNGTYRCRTIGGKPEYDENGKMKLDEFNPEPSLRKIPIHQAIIISGLRYNAEKKQWDGGKIHNPLKRIEKANCTVDFVDGGKTLRVFGNLLGIGKSVYWKAL